MTRTARLVLPLVAVASASFGCLEVQDFGSATRQVVDSGPASPQFGGDGGPDSSQVAPAWQLVNPQPSANDLHAIWGLSDNDIWVAGTHGTVLRWDGTALHDMSPQGLDETLYGVWASSDQDVWVLGTGEGGTAEILHWDGSAWSSNYAINGPASASETASISGSGPDNVWVVGLGDGIGGAVVWNGRQWAGTQSTVPFTATGQAMHDVWTFGPNDTWVVGDDGIVHYDGSTWTLATDTNPATSGNPFNAANRYVGVWGQAPNDVWAVFVNGQIATTAGPGAVGVSHWDGTSWSVQPTPLAGAFPQYTRTCDTRICGRGIAAGSGNVFVPVISAPFEMLTYESGAWSGDSLSAGAWGDQINGVWADTNGTLFAVSNVGAIVRRDPVSFNTTANQWKVTIAPVDSAFRDSLSGVSIGSDQTVWAVAETSEQTLVTWTGAGWAPLPNPAPVTPQFLWVNNVSDGWAAGNLPGQESSVELAHWNGMAWQSIAVPSSYEIGALWSDGPSDLWTVGRDYQWSTDGNPPYALLHWDGARWSTILAPTQSVWMRALSGTSANDIWIYGADSATSNTGQDTGVALHWDGTSLTESYRSSTGGLTGSVWTSGPSDVWVGGCHFNGTAWSEWQGDAFPISTWGSGPNDVWFVVANQGLVHWDGTTLEGQLGTPEGPPLMSVSGSGPDNVWTVGAGGTTYRFSRPGGASSTP